MLEAKSGPWGALGKACEDIIPYSFLPIYLYLLIADIISPTTVLRGRTWDSFLAAGNCSLHQPPAHQHPLKHSTATASFQNE